jgi:hypothetical protein
MRASLTAARAVTRSTGSTWFWANGLQVTWDFMDTVSHNSVRPCAGCPKLPAVSILVVRFVVACTGSCTLRANHKK